MDIRKGNHCAYDIHYHFVFPVKYRKALLSGEVEQHLLRVSHALAERFDLEIDAVGADLDHVHLLCSAHPKDSPAKDSPAKDSPAKDSPAKDSPAKDSPAKIVQVYKSNTAIQEQHRYTRATPLYKSNTAIQEQHRYTRATPLYKSNTARELFAAFPNLRKELWGGHFWTSGYYIATVGQRGTWNTLVKYVIGQGKKPPAVNLHLFS